MACTLIMGGTFLADLESYPSNNCFFLIELAKGIATMRCFIHKKTYVPPDWICSNTKQFFTFFVIKKKNFRKCSPNHVCVFSPPRAVVRPFSFVLQYIEAASCCSLWEVALAFSWVSWCKVFLDCFSFWHFSTVLNLHLIDIVEVFPWMNTCSTIWQWRDKIHQRDQWQGVRFDRWHIWQLRPSTMSLVIVVGGERMPAFTYVYICI